MTSKGGGRLVSLLPPEQLQVETEVEAQIMTGFVFEANLHLQRPVGTWVHKNH